MCSQSSTQKCVKLKTNYETYCGMRTGRWKAAESEMICKQTLAPINLQVNNTVVGGA